MMGLVILAIIICGCIALADLDEKQKENKELIEELRKIARREENGKYN